MSLALTEPKHILQHEVKTGSGVIAPLTDLRWQREESATEKFQLNLSEIDQMTKWKELLCDVEICFPVNVCFLLPSAATGCAFDEHMQPFTLTLTRQQTRHVQHCWSWFTEGLRKKKGRVDLQTERMRTVSVKCVKQHRKSTATHMTPSLKPHSKVLDERIEKIYSKIFKLDFLS